MSCGFHEDIVTCLAFGRRYINDGGMLIILGAEGVN